MTKRGYVRLLDEISTGDLIILEASGFSFNLAQFSSTTLQLRLSSSIPTDEEQAEKIHWHLSCVFEEKENC